MTAPSNDRHFHCPSISTAVNRNHVHQRHPGLQEATLRPRDCAASVRSIEPLPLKMPCTLRSVEVFATQSIAAPAAALEVHQRRSGFDRRSYVRQFTSLAVFALRFDRSPPSLGRRPSKDRSTPGLTPAITRSFRQEGVVTGFIDRLLAGGRPGPRAPATGRLANHR